jgi:hypothetical protein
MSSAHPFPRLGGRSNGPHPGGWHGIREPPASADGGSLDLGGDVMRSSVDEPIDAQGTGTGATSRSRNSEAGLRTTPSVPDHRGVRP